jgi:DNA-binding PucR family transcriptional regulator
LATADAVVAVSASSAEVVDDLLSSFPGPALVGDVDGEIFGLLGTSGPAAVVAGLKDMVRTIEPALSSAGFALGISVDTTNLRAAIQEARYARRLAESSAGRVVVMAGDEVASHQLLLAAVPDDLRRSFSLRVLGPVADYDAAHKSELMRTLRVFLESAGSWAQAAAELHVHVNTLRYRIGRVAELTGRDLNSFSDRVDLYLALGRRAP